LIVNPWCTTHQQLTDKDRNAAGVSEDHMRLSVGIEHIDDLKADLKQAFERIEEEVVNEEQESDRYELQKKMICALYGVPPNRIEATV
jgi:O-acetylhomoserine/O-acetylserine sulfhydrylase